MKNKLLIGLVVLTAGALVGWYFLKGPASLPQTDSGMMQETAVPAGSNLGTPDPVSDSDAMYLEKGGEEARTVVTYTDAGFAPASVTVKAGAVVTFVNEGNGPMWVASDPHPSHSLLPGFDAKKNVLKGEAYEYTFAKAGTWTYHNHLNPGMTGTVIVTQ